MFNFRQQILAFTHLLVVLSGFTTLAQAQMFSQGSIDRGTSYRSSQVLLGTEWLDFSYRGGQPTAPGERYDVSGNALVLQLETDAIDMYLRGMGKLTGSSNEALFNLGARLHNRFTLVRNSGFRLFFPVQLQTDLLRSRRDASSRQFQQTIVQAGAGLSAQAGFAESLRLTLSMIPSYGFSNSAGAFFGGSVRSLDGRARLAVSGILPNRHLVIGYDYRSRKYDIDIDTFDYRLRSHTVVLGFTF